MRSPFALRAWCKVSGMSRSQPSASGREERATQSAADTVLMIRPAAFGRNEVTRPTNRFQAAPDDVSPERTAAVAVLEFDACVAALKSRGIDVQVFPGRTTTTLPDEVFPNNWISTHPDGTAVLYPMLAWNRREERRRDVLEQLQKQAEGFRIERLVDLSPLESQNCFLEGTGSLVFDHGNRIGYACLSPRTHVEALKEFVRQADYDVVHFIANDAGGHAIYHTNVMLSIGESFAIVCADAIPAVEERVRVLTRLERSGREVIEFRVDQLRSFVGNLIQLRAGDRRFIALSRQARAGLDESQLEALSRHGELVTLDVRTIEANGGGSVRCMLAELFLPRKTQPEGTIVLD
jgi:hypothetical protein